MFFPSYAPSLLTLALPLGMLLGGLWPWRMVTPVLPSVLFQRFLEASERRLNRARRSDADRRARGAVLALAVVAAAAGLGWGVSLLFRQLAWGGMAEIVVVALLVPARGVAEHVWRVRRHLEREEKMPEWLLHAFLRRDTAERGEGATARASIDYLAENFCDQVVAPYLWYMAAGLPGLLVCQAINRMDGAWGYRSRRLAAFGMVPALLDDIINYIPARIGGLVVCVAALFAPGCSVRRAFATLWSAHGKTASPNSGWPLAAFAGALGVTLAGPRRRHDAVIDDKWIGAGSAKLGIVDIRRALVVYGIGWLMLVLAAAQLSLILR